MKIAPELDNLLLFVLLIFPGLISMHIYRLIMPAKEIDWKTALVEALFYGTLNFGICLPIIIPIHRNQFPDRHIWLYILFLIFVLVIAPIFWPLLLKLCFSCKKLMKKLQLPFPTAWDYYFDARKTCFVLIHLKNGKMIGGFYGNKSYSTSFPRHGDLYLEKVVQVDKDGKFVKIIEGSEGMLVPQDSYDYIEMFEHKNTNSQGDQNGKRQD